MPNFTDPFPGISDKRPIACQDLVRAIRMDLAAEQDATALYMAHASATDNLAAKELLTNIANEERVHAGEFLRMLELLDTTEKPLLQQGASEVDNPPELSRKLVPCIDVASISRKGTNHG